NPHNAVCPDFWDSVFDGHRQELVDNGTAASEEAAVEHLVARWKERNAQEKEAWDRDHPQNEEPQPRPRAPSPVVNKPEDGRNSATRAAVPKGPVFAPAALGVPPPKSLDAPPSQHAQNKLKAGQYVQLWYFTPEGIQEATSTLYSGREDAITLEREDSALVLSTHSGSKKAVDDEHLTWNQVSLARSTFLTWANTYRWPEDHTDMLARFWFNLDIHPLRAKEGGDRACVVYQARMRRLWHQSLDGPSPFDLSIIDDGILERIAQDL
ncbi:hypothetical protein C8T65DRAFT_556637, partial [Cerioporus squamosus]